MQGLNSQPYGPKAPSMQIVPTLGSKESKYLLWEEYSLNNIRDPAITQF